MSLLNLPYLMMARVAGGEGGNPLNHLVDHILDHELGWAPHPFLTKHRFIIMLAAVLLIVFLVPICSRSVAVPRGLRNVIEAMVQYMRTSVIGEYIHGKDAARFTPYFLTVFFFVLAMNLVGLVPMSATATANVAVTLTLALCTFAMVLISGMAAQGVGKFWVNLVPSGVPGWLWPMLFVIEVIGLVSKHFALTVRLAANMTAGHLILGALIALIVVSKNAIYVIIPSLAGGIFIGCLEIFVAFLQAYIFTFLSAVFVGAALHPDH